MCHLLEGKKECCRVVTCKGCTAYIKKDSKMPCV